MRILASSSSRPKFKRLPRSLLWYRCLMKKKIIFFDGDGTLWYPSLTKWAKVPYWIYSDKEIGKDYLGHLELTPGAKETLEELKKERVKLFLLSIIPFPQSEAQRELEKKVNYWGIQSYFEEVIAVLNDPAEKGKIIQSILEKRNVLKSEALLVGDSYRYDYLSAEGVGVDAVLIAAEYRKDLGQAKETIKALPELINYLQAKQF